MINELEFLNQLKRELAENLPGEQAHIKMAPQRPLTSSAIQKNTYREAAVAIVLYRDNNQIECILTQRSVYNGSHSGQISFPGGKCEPEDLVASSTARRECYEEIGIPADQGELIGQLSDVYIPVSGFLVHPFIFYYKQLPALTKNEREVAEILTFPLFDLKKEEVISTMEVQLPNGTIYKDVPYFDLAQKKVWGATALMLNEVREILFNIETDLLNDF